MKLPSLLIFLMLNLQWLGQAQGQSTPEEKSEAVVQSGEKGSKTPVADIFRWGGLNIVIGVGLGNFSFSTADSERGPLTQFGAAAFPVVEQGGNIIDDGVLRQFFIELYYGHFGIGLRRVDALNTLNRFFTASNAGNNFRVVQSVEISHSLLTGQFVYPVSKAKSVYVGGILGLGKSEYTSTYFFSISFPEDSQEQFTADGSSTLAGVFLDLGGDGFGARVGLHQIWAELGPLTGPNGVVSGSNADATGWAWYVDLRYLF